MFDLLVYRLRVDSNINDYKKKLKLMKATLLSITLLCNFFLIENILDIFILYYFFIK